MLDSNANDNFGFFYFNWSRFYRRYRGRWRSHSAPHSFVRRDLFKYMIGPSLVGALLGSFLIGMLNRQAAEPTVAILLVSIALIVFFKPSFGSEAPAANPLARTKLTRQKIVLLSFAGFAIGVHDGFFGPGAGIFLIFALIHFGKSTFLEATSTSKIINLLTSSIALFAFIRGGQVNWTYGIAGSIGVMIGSNIGARHAELKVASLIRPVFLCIAIAISLRLIF